MNEVEKILNSLQTAKILNAGQKLSTLSKVAFGDFSYDSKRKTQNILYKLRREYKAMYVRETKVWYLWENQ